ncbi:MAG: Flp family type IVb pilin [Acidimicrobiia bacterium]|jgi:Flp pilus assembly pilin Flp
MAPRPDDVHRPLKLYFHPQRGATAVEYGMLVALIAAVAIASVALLGGTVQGLFESVQWW